MINDIEARLRFLEQKSFGIQRKSDLLKGEIGKFAQDVMMTLSGFQNGGNGKVDFIILLTGCNGLPLDNEYISVVPVLDNRYTSGWPTDDYAILYIDSTHVQKTDRNGYAKFSLSWPMYYDRDGNGFDISSGNSCHFIKNSDGFWVIDKTQSSQTTGIIKYFASVVMNKVFSYYLDTNEIRNYYWIFNDFLSVTPKVNTNSDTSDRPGFFVSTTQWSSAIANSPRPRKLRKVIIPDGNGNNAIIDYDYLDNPEIWGDTLRYGLVYTDIYKETTAYGLYAIQWVIQSDSYQQRSSVSRLTARVPSYTSRSGGLTLPVAYGVQTTSCDSGAATASFSGNPIQVKFDFSSTRIYSLTGIDHVTMEDCGDPPYAYFAYQYYNANNLSNPWIDKNGYYAYLSDSNTLSYGYVNVSRRLDLTFSYDRTIVYPGASDYIISKTKLQTVSFSFQSNPGSYVLNKTPTGVTYWYNFSFDIFNQKPTLTVNAKTVNGFYIYGGYYKTSQTVVDVQESAVSYIGTGYGQSFEFIFNGNLSKDLGVGSVSIIFKEFDAARLFSTTGKRVLSSVMDPIIITDNNNVISSSLVALRYDYYKTNTNRKFFVSSKIQPCMAYNQSKDVFEKVMGYPVYWYQSYYAYDEFLNSQNACSLQIIYRTIYGLPQCASSNGNTFPCGNIYGKENNGQIFDSVYGNDSGVRQSLTFVSHNNSTHTDTYSVPTSVSDLLGITSVTISHGDRKDYLIFDVSFGFDNNSQGWYGYPSYSASRGAFWDNSHGSAVGCLSGFASTGYGGDLPFSFTYSGTWQSLGVPANAMVQSIGLHLKENGRGGVTSSTFGPHVLADANGATREIMRMPEQIQPVFPDSWRQVVCENVVVPLDMQSSSSSIKLILNGVAAGGDTSDTYVSFDDVVFTIFYKAQSNNGPPLS
jgi:hypothetical protein